MDIVLLPDGKPGEDLGIAHTLKHWLDPAELWDDLAVDLAADVHPRQVRDALPDTLTPPWKSPTRPDGTIRARWSQLGHVYRDGYGTVVQACAGAMPSPDSAPHMWRRGGRAAVPTAVDAGRGIILRVRRSQEGWELYTAFRPAIAQFSDLACPPTDAQNVSMRRKLYGLRALRLLSHWGQDEESP